MTRTCANPLCGASLAGKRPHARYCRPVCGSAFRRIARRRQRTYEHPRCVICSAPMAWPDRGRFGGPYRPLRSVTCSRRCAYTRANWMRVA